MQGHALGDGGGLGGGAGELRADHQLGELTRGGAGRVDGRDRRTAADHGDLVGDREDLVELVGDEDDREALGLELAQIAEELVHLLRHQDGGGLVEDDHLRAAVEDLEDLHALAGTDAQLLDQLVRLDAEAVGVGDPHDLLAGARADAVQLLGTEDDVLQDGEVVGELEVLEDHADAVLDRVGGRAEADLGATDLDGPGVGGLHAVQDLHQRRLAGAVLTHDRVDRAASHVDVDVVVRDHAREPLADPPQAHRRCDVGHENPFRSRKSHWMARRRSAPTSTLSDGGACTGSRRPRPPERTWPARWSVTDQVTVRWAPRSRRR